MIRKFRLATAVAVTLVLAAPAAFAQSADAWRFQASIYGYFPDIGGHSTFPQATAGTDVRVDSSTIIDNLKGTFMGSLEAQKGPWGLFTDVMYMDIGGSKSGTRQLTIGGNPLPAGASAEARYDLTGWVWTLGGTWRLSSDPASPVQLLAGARMLDIEQKLGWQVTGNVGPIPVPGRGGELKTSGTNWDAIVGVKGRLAFGEGRRWFVPYYLDVGAGESKLTWQAMTGLGYAFGWGDVVGAWRYLSYDMKSGEKVEDMNFNGPAIAAVFHW